MPLTISRKVGQVVKIGDEIFVTVARMEGNSVRLSIAAPDEINIARLELVDDKKPKPESKES